MSSLILVIPLFHSSHSARSIQSGPEVISIADALARIVELYPCGTLVKTTSSMGRANYMINRHLFRDFGDGSVMVRGQNTMSLVTVDI